MLLDSNTIVSLDVFHDFLLVLVACVISVRVAPAAIRVNIFMASRVPITTDSSLF